MNQTNTELLPHKKATSLLTEDKIIWFTSPKAEKGPQISSVNLTLILLSLLSLLRSVMAVYKLRFPSEVYPMDYLSSIQGAPGCHRICYTCF